MDPRRFVASVGTVIQATGPEGRFHAFVPNPVPRQVVLDPETVYLLSQADDALGRLAGAGGLLPNPHLLVEAYLTQEAVASSRIEGTLASLTEVFQAVAGAGVSSPDVQEVENYIGAMNEGLRLLADIPVCLRLVKEVHAALMQGVRGGDKRPGEYRARQNWIGSPGDEPQTATFVPPPVGSLEELLRDWEQYANEYPRMPVLVQCALLHYQFETIHPFLDGNGRLGRLLIVLFLVQRGRLPQPLLSISRYFENNRREYYERLQAVRERGEIQEWLQFFLHAVEAQARDAVLRAQRLTDLREQYREALKGTRTRAPELIDLLLGNPVLTSHRVEAALQVTNPGAHNLIRQVERLGIIQYVGTYGRGGRRYWVAGAILACLEADTAEPD